MQNDDERNPDDQRKAEELGHEPIAISANAVAKGFAVLFGVLFASLLLIGGFMMLLSRVDGGTATVEAPKAPEEVPAGVPELDSNQRGSLRALRKRETEMLTEYAWVDPNAGIARIPIKRAMEILSQRTTSQPQSTSDAPANP